MKSVGYIYGIKDPESHQFIFVGFGYQPWESVERHFRDSSNPDLKRRFAELKVEWDGQWEILHEIVCDRWHDPGVQLPVVPEGTKRLEWEVLALQDDHLGLGSVVEDGKTIIRFRSKVWQIINRLRREGHPLFNRRLGRRAVEG